MKDLNDDLREQLCETGIVTWTPHIYFPDDSPIPLSANYWSLAELLDVLPKEIIDEGKYVLCMRSEGDWFVQYVYQPTEIPFLLYIKEKAFSTNDKSLPNALAKMILKLNKEGLL